MKTAVEWYAEQEVKLTLDFLAKKLNEIEYGLYKLELLNKANKMFEDQIIDAFCEDKYEYRGYRQITLSGEDYYNETFKSEE